MTQAKTRRNRIIVSFLVLVLLLPSHRAKADPYTETVIATAIFSGSVAAAGSALLYIFLTPQSEYDLDDYHAVVIQAFCEAVTLTFEVFGISPYYFSCDALALTLVDILNGLGNTVDDLRDLSWDDLMAAFTNAQDDLEADLAPFVEQAVNDMVPAPTALTVSASLDRFVVLEWERPASDDNLAGYVVYRSTNPGDLIQGQEAPGQFERAEVNEEAYADWSITPGTTYYYGVASVSDTGNVGVLSNIVSAGSDPQPTELGLCTDGFNDVMDFGTQSIGLTASYNCSVCNNGDSEMTWSIREIEPSNGDAVNYQWLSLSPQGGTVTLRDCLESDPFSVVIDTTGLIPDTDYEAWIRVETDTELQDIHVTMRTGSDSAPQLRWGQVDPGNGDVTTQFLFTVNYRDYDNDQNPTGTVYVDDSAYSMTSDDDEYDDWATFTSASLEFSQGTHSYRFEFQDQDGNVVYYPSTGTKSLTVGPNPNASLYFARPDGGLDDLVIRSEDPTYELDWTSVFVEGSDSVNFYYDTDRNPDNGLVCIATDLPISGQMRWNTETGEVLDSDGNPIGTSCGPTPPDGSYYIYGELASGDDDHYSPGRLTILSDPLVACLYPWEYRDLPPTGWSYPDIAVGSNNVLHIVWENNSQIYYIRSRDGGTTWTVPVQISNAVNWAAAPASAAYQSEVVAAWRQNDDGSARIYFVASHDGGISWDPPELVSEEHTGCEVTEVAVFSDGAHVVWGRGTSIWYRGSPDFGDTWCGRREVATNAGNFDSSPPVVEADSSGVHVVYYDAWTYGANGLYHVGGSTCGAFGSPSHIEPGSGSQGASWQRMALGPSGLHLVYRKSGGPAGVIYHTKSTNGGSTWSLPPTVLTFPSGDYSTTMPDVACWGQVVRVVCTLTLSGNAYGTLFMESGEGGAIGSWCRPQQLSTSLTDPRIEVDGVGISHVIGNPRAPNPVSYARQVLLSLDEPDTTGGTADTFFTVRWTLSDPSRAVDVYYDSNQIREGGRIVVEEDVLDRSESSWDCQDFPDGAQYYVCIEIEAGGAYVDPVTIYSPAPVTIEHPNIPPTLAELPAIVIFEDGEALDGFNVNRFADDAETPDAGLAYSVVSGSDENLSVTIDQDGFVDVQPAPNWLGTRTITIRVEDEEGSTAESSLEVRVVETAEGVLLTPGSVTLMAGSTVDVEALTTDGTDGSYVWSSDASAVATIASTGQGATATAHDAGRAQIQAVGHSTNKIGIADIVVAPSAPTVAAPTSTTLTISLASINQGSTAEFACYCFDLAKYVEGTGRLVDNPVWQPAGSWGSVIVQELAPETSYTFAVLGRRGSDETGFGPPAAGVTLTDTGSEGDPDGDSPDLPDNGGGGPEVGPVGPSGLTTTPACGICGVGGATMMPLVVLGMLLMKCQVRGWRRRSTSAG